MASTMSLEWVAPRLFAGAGVLLLALAVYMAGGDWMACQRNDGRIDCRFSRSRVLGKVTVERVTVPDVVDAWVRTSTTSQETYRSGRGATAEHTSSNDTLMLHTRDGRDVATIGGEISASCAAQIIALVKAAAPSSANTVDSSLLAVNVKDELTSFSADDSYVPIAVLCGVLGMIFTIFGLVAMRFGAPAPRTAAS